MSENWWRIEIMYMTVNHLSKIELDGKKDEMEEIRKAVLNQGLSIIRRYTNENVEKLISVKCFPTNK